MCDTFRFPTLTMDACFKNLARLWLHRDGLLKFFQFSETKSERVVYVKSERFVKKRTDRYVSLRIFYRMYGNSGSFLAVTRRIAAHHGGGYHGGLSRYRLFLVAAPTCHLTLTRRLWINRPTFCSWLTSDENNKALCTLFSQSGTVDTTQAAATGRFCPFLVALGLDCAPSTNKQPRPKVHLQVLRGMLPHNSRADMKQFISWKGTRKSVVPVFLLVKHFLYRYFPTVKYVSRPSVNSSERRKIHTLIHLLAPPFSKCVLKKTKTKHASLENQPNRTVKRHS